MSSRVGRGTWIAAALALLAIPAAAQVRTGIDTVPTPPGNRVSADSTAELRLSAPILGALATETYNPGSLTLAVGETLLANFIPWMFNEYVTRYKDITRISPTSWKSNVAAGPKWDDNHFHINLLAHPYAGSLYYAAGRSNGYNFEKAFFFTLLGSALWECCGESHRPSAGDLFSTTVGGTALGEMIHRWTNQILNRGKGPPRNAWWEVPSGVLSPVLAFTRWTLGRFSAPNPDFEKPEHWAVFTSAGARSGAGGFLETGYTYGDVVAVSKSSRPFSHFETAVDLDFFAGAKQTIGRIQARGSLWSRRIVKINTACAVTQAIGPGIPALGNCNISYFNIIPFLGFDYINNNAYEFGGQSVGLAAFLTLGQYPGGTHGVLAADGHGFFGGVQSEHAKRGQLHDLRSERFREYDFTLGTGFGGAAILSHRCVRMSAFYRRNRLDVVNGSNEDAGPANHKTTFWGITGRCKIFWRVGLGLDYRRYHRESQFDPALTPPAVIQADDRWGFFLTLDRKRPLGLFVF